MKTNNKKMFMRYNSNVGWMYSAGGEAGYRPSRQWSEDVRVAAVNHRNTLTCPELSVALCTGKVLEFTARVKVLP